MDDNTIVYQRFMVRSEAEETEQLLKKNNIACTIVAVSSGLDGSFGGNYDKEFEVRIQEADRAAADTALAQEARSDIAGLPEDYYLFGFTDEELLDVMRKRDEWNALDYQLALKLLKERGVEVDHADIEKAAKQRVVELSKPEKTARGWLVAAYLFALMGGFFGIVFGYILYSSKKTLPDGRVMYRYTQTDRSHGRVIMLLGLTVILITWTIALLPE